jgi:pyridoxal phosphate enzyme (YggS family)
MTTIAGRLTEVRARMARAAARSGRDPGTVRLVAVSKKRTAAEVLEAYRAGASDFGENYVQELLAKAAAVGAPDIRWHHIGQLQTNKARAVVGKCWLVHGVDRPSLAEEISRRSLATSIIVDVLLQVNVAGEESKAGCSPADLPALLERASTLQGVRVRGLMLIPPEVEDPEAARVHFRELRALRDRHGGAAYLPELSMGMSHDFEVAIEEGATIVRVGTAIFGPRSG